MEIMITDTGASGAEADYEFTVNGMDGWMNDRWRVNQRQSTLVIPWGAGKDVFHIDDPHQLDSTPPHNTQTEPW